MTKNLGFTLAEVLITLGIIGVVAAMTMPTLINQTNGAQYKAAYKKALSAISQAVTLNVALDDESFAETIAGEAGKTTAGNGKTDDAKTEGTTIASLLNSRMNIVSATTKPSAADYPITEAASGDGNVTSLGADTYLFFNDSSMFAFKSSDKECTKISTTASKNTGCKGFIDVNGLKGPNKVVTCDANTGTPATYKDPEKTQIDKAAVPCKVSSPTDIYPVLFYDQTIVPNSDAAKAVLYGK